MLKRRMSTLDESTVSIRTEDLETPYRSLHKKYIYNKRIVQNAQSKEAYRHLYIKIDHSKAQDIKKFGR